MERVATVTVCASSPLAPPPAAACLQTPGLPLVSGNRFWTKGVWGRCLRRRTSKELKGQDWAEGESNLQCINSSCWGPSWSCGGSLTWNPSKWSKGARPLSPHIRQLLGWAALRVVVPCNWGQLPMQMETLGWEWSDWSYSRDLGEPQYLLHHCSRDSQPLAL